jgi:NitT/TauT family transport system permease protein
VTQAERAAASPPARAFAAAGRRVWSLAPALIAMALALLVWQAWTGRGRQLIPPPLAIGQAIMEEWSSLLPAVVATLTEALGGLAIGTTAGLLVAFLAARWATARDILIPVAIGASAIPLVAAAPIMIHWFGLLNPLSMMAMASLVVFFPIVINVTRGLVDVDPRSLELMASYAASELTVLRKVRIPNMLPYFFTALKVSTTLAFIGALVGEYFGGASKVLGKVVMTSMSNGSFAVAWGAIVIGATCAIVSYAIVASIERIAIPWASALRSEQP